MEASIANIRDFFNKKIIYPITKAKAVYMEDNTKVEDRIKDLQNSFASCEQNINNINLDNYATHDEVSSASSCQISDFGFTKTGNNGIIEKNNLTGVVHLYINWFDFPLNNGAILGNVDPQYIPSANVVLWGYSIMNSFGSGNLNLAQITIKAGTGEIVFNSYEAVAVTNLFVNGYYKAAR